MKNIFSVLLIILGISLTFGGTGYVNSIHQPTEYENCTIQGKPSHQYTVFALKTDNVGTIVNYCIDASTDAGKRITAYVLMAFSNDIKVSVVDQGDATVICGGTNITGYKLVIYMDLLKNWVLQDIFGNEFAGT